MKYYINKSITLALNTASLNTHKDGFWEHQHITRKWISQRREKTNTLKKRIEQVRIYIDMSRIPQGGTNKSKKVFLLRNRDCKSDDTTKGKSFDGQSEKTLPIERRRKVEDLIIHLKLRRTHTTTKKGKRTDSHNQIKTNPTEWNLTKQTLVKTLVRKNTRLHKERTHHHRNDRKITRTWRRSKFYWFHLFPSQKGIQTHFLGPKNRV